ncbi:Inositol-tetrakisphosphate 1-kinase [Heracleum sosnowskyi]|uniref:Inositol-tetrakisphosphate 1-kinase n=1 Tax=Heracleum sosnowskyi TaxID=360622 RepID=A0AAD8JBA4_9APIA|nr:Inositol-tetrakisphosphate 1-kinase [Heracleum sosnowskyi]
MSDEKKIRIRIGYALKPRTSECLIKQSLLDHAKNQGIQLVEINASEPLIPQGPFDAIIHKLYDDEWNQKLNCFASENPNVVIVDSPCDVERLHNRVSMLEAVGKMKKKEKTNALVSIPEQVVVQDSKLLSDLSAFDDLKFPVIAKPLLANANSNSHQMSLVFNNNGLMELEAPLILQQFVNHGGVIFKVYVAGKYVKCVLRNSLPDISDEKLKNSGNLMPFSQISNIGPGGKNVDEVDMPAMSFVEQVGQGLRQALNLNLFNFDLIRDSEDKSRYFIIDINYFPGYEKLPSYESLLTDFFKDILMNNDDTPKACCQNGSSQPVLQFANGAAQQEQVIKNGVPCEPEL